MRISITKEYTFEAAHSLPHHNGKCKNLHGHSYQLFVTVTGPIKTEGPGEGMVMDFGELDPIVKTHIIDVFDHRFLNDILPFTTTVENIAAYIFTTLTEKGLPISEIKLYETKKCFATVT